MNKTLKHFQKIGHAVLAFPHWQFVISTALLLFICMTIWIDMPQGPFAGTDGRLFKTFITAHIDFSRPLSFDSLNPLLGMGNQSMLMNTWLHPAYLPFYFFSDSTAVFISAMLSLLALVSSCYFFSRTWGLGKATSIFAAQLSTLLFFPFHYEFDQLGLYLLNPGFAISNAWVVIELSLLYKLADQFSKGRLGVPNLFLMFVIAMLGILIDPIGFVTTSVYYLPIFAATIFVFSMRNRWLVMGAITSLVMIFYFLGIIQYLQNLAIYTATGFVPLEIPMRPVTPHLYLSLFLGKSAPVYLFLGIGLLSCIAIGVRQQRLLSYSVVVHIVLLIALSCVWFIADNWHLPGVVYIENTVMAVWLIAGAAGISLIIDRLFKHVPSFIERIGRAAPLSLHIKSDQTPSIIGTRLRLTARWIVVFAVPFMCIYYSAVVKPDRYGIYIEEVEKMTPPRKLLATLDKYAIRGGRFSGYVVVVEHSPELWVRLWQSKIPTVNEYSITTTPFFHYFFTRLYAPEFIFKDTIYDMLGVSAIITRHPIESSAYNLTGRYRSNKGSWNSYLYEKSQPVSILNPTAWEYKGSLKEIYDEILSPNFNPREKVLVQEPLAAKLVAARSSNLTVIRGGYRVSAAAEGEGSSLLLLPIQFSHRFTVKNDSSKPISLFRANGLLTGVMFQGNVTFDLLYANPIFSPAGAASRDIDDLRQGMKGLPPGPSAARPGAKLDLYGAVETIKTFLLTTAPAEWFLNKKQTLFPSITEYKFSPNKDACQPFAANTDRYTGIAYLQHYGPAGRKDENAWFQKPVEKNKTLEMSEPFLGFGWGPIKDTGQGYARQLAFGHNEGLVMFRGKIGKRYKVRFRWINVPANIYRALTVSFNGVKSDHSLEGQEGSFSWREFTIDEAIINSCNGWVEILVSTRGNTLRPPGKRNADWSGRYFVLQSISFDIDNGRAANLNN